MMASITCWIKLQVITLYQLIRLESSNIFYKKQVFLATFEILIDLCYKIDLIDDML